MEVTVPSSIRRVVSRPRYAYILSYTTSRAGSGWERMDGRPLPID